MPMTDGEKRPPKKEAVTAEKATTCTGCSLSRENSTS